MFTFAEDDPETLTGKARQAYRSGFLGLHSFGWSTLVQIDEISPAEEQALVEALARYLMTEFGAPSMAEALPFARQELEYAAGLCEYAAGTLLMLQRHGDEEGIHETFRRVQPEAPPPPKPQKADWRGSDGPINIWNMFPEDATR